MEGITQLKVAILAALSIIGSVITNQLGGWDASMKILIGIMAVDYITGLLVAGVFKKSNKSETGALESRAGYKGLCRKVAILLFVWVAYLLDSATGSAYIRTAVCLFYTANEGLSIIENLSLMGVPFPSQVKKALEVMKEKADTGEAAS